MDSPRQEYWSGLPFPSLWDLPDPGIKPVSSSLAGGFLFFLTTDPLGKSSLDIQFSSVTQSCLDSLQPYGLQHTRHPCPSLTPRVYANSCPLSWWCHTTILSSVVPFSSCPQISPASGIFPNQSDLCIRWPKYWCFSFSIRLPLPQTKQGLIVWKTAEWPENWLFKDTGICYEV